MGAVHVGSDGAYLDVEGSLATIIGIEASRAASGTVGAVLVIQSAAVKASLDVTQEGDRALAAETSLAIALARDASSARRVQFDIIVTASAATSSWSSAVLSLGLALAGEVSRTVFVETVLSVSHS